MTNPTEKHRHVRLGNDEVPYQLIRAKRKSLGLQIGDEGLTVRAPARASIFEIESVLQEKAAWVKSRLAYWRQCQSKLCALPNLLSQGLGVPVLGQQFRVEYVSELRRSRIDLTNCCITISTARPDTEEGWVDVAKKLERLLKPVAKEAFIETATEVASRGEYPGFTVMLSSAKHRWGSCNSKGELRLNWRLVFYHAKAIEYVIAHEMAHLKEMNHSAAFWQIVEQLMPDYRQHHTYLADMHPDKVPISR